MRRLSIDGLTGPAYALRLRNDSLSIFDAFLAKDYADFAAYNTKSVSSVFIRG
jgi:hypothetical protein